MRLRNEPASLQINIEYNISYIYHSLYAFFDRDNIGLPGKPSSHTQQAPFVSLARGCFSSVPALRVWLVSAALLLCRCSPMSEVCALRYLAGLVSTDG